ncbi:transcription factor lux, partial [Phtheirospermum japonicum]
ARALKHPRLVWTPQLHKQFVDAVAHLGIKNAVPKTIMQLMSVDGLTRENVTSHLQKYHFYLMRMQVISNGGPAAAATAFDMDAATDHLFASSLVPRALLALGDEGGSTPPDEGDMDPKHFLSFIYPHHQMT